MAFRGCWWLFVVCSCVLCGVICFVMSIVVGCALFVVCSWVFFVVGCCLSMVGQRALLRVGCWLCVVCCFLLVVI